MKRGHTDFFTVKMSGSQGERAKVVAMKSEYDEDRRIYKVSARIRWRRPRHGVELRNLKSIREIPVSIVKEFAGRCKTCGGTMSLEGERIQIISSDGLDGTFVVNGYLICSNCSKSLPIRKRVGAALRSIWRNLSHIREFKITVDGIHVVK